MSTNTTQVVPAPALPKLQRQFLFDAISIQSGLPAEFLDTERQPALIERAVSRVRERIFGQELALSQLVAKLKVKSAERFVGWDEAVRVLRPTWDRRPMATFLAAGPTGVGKSETARILADTLFGGRLIALNATDAGPEAAHGTSAWTGSPPGYVGSDRGGILTNGLRQFRSGVILIDELEKADRMAVQNIILPLMGDGIVTDRNNGETLHATDFIVFCTSNMILRPEVLQAMGFHSGDDAEATGRAVFDALAAHILPEVIGRFNAILRFQPLSLETQWQVWSGLRHELATRIGPGNRIVLDAEAKRFIQDQFAQIQTGARGIRDLFLDQVVPLTIGARTGDTINLILRSGRLAKADPVTKAA
jgi:ATP-dependent Clp protease ATP-binding subunit ClpA